MKKVIAYEVFSCNTPTDLELYVNQKIRAGWQPLGAMHPVAVNSGELLFTQALVKYEN
jgi:hypothetical protein